MEQVPINQQREEERLASLAGSILLKDDEEKSFSKK